MSKSNDNPTVKSHRISDREIEYIARAVQFAIYVPVMFYTFAKVNREGLPNLSNEMVIAIQAILSLLIVSGSDFARAWFIQRAIKQRQKT